MISGAAEVAVGAAAFKDDNTSCSGSYCVDNATMRHLYYGTGGASIGVGVVLLLVGLRKKE